MTISTSFKLSVLVGPYTNPFYYVVSWVSRVDFVLYLDSIAVSDSWVSRFPLLLF